MENQKTQPNAIQRAFDLYYGNAKPTDSEAKLMKEIQEETETELRARLHRSPDCMNNSASHSCSNKHGSPCT